MMKDSIKRHSKEWAINQKGWETKPELKEAYSTIYSQINKFVQGENLLEIGSGLCKGKAWIKNLVTSNRIQNPWVDRVESAYKISSEPNSWDTIIMLDVFHHLEHPKAALLELHRVLKQNGRVIIFEPDVNLLGWLAYGVAHKEPVAYHKKISEKAYPPEPESYYACQSSAHQIFLKGKYKTIYSGFKINNIIRLPMISYILTGGFSGPNILQFLPKKIVKKIEDIGKNFPSIFSTRVLVELKKT